VVSGQKGPDSPEFSFLAPLIQQRLVSWAQFALGSIGTYVFLVHENTEMLFMREAK
jgi:hypothetical protein